MQRSEFDAPSGRLIDVPGSARRRPYLAFVPDPLPPSAEREAIASVGSLLSDADQSLGELIGVGRVLPEPDLLVRPYLRQEAVASSAIEGTRATFADLVAFETGRFAGADSDVVDVMNYTSALSQGLAAVGEGGITADLVRRAHRTVMSGARGEEYSMPGEFRTIQNHIGGGREPAEGDFVPPPPAEMQDSLDALFAYIGDHRQRPPVLVEAAWVHYQFETIHPFIDGNGRVGRLLIPLLIAQRRQYPHPLLYLSPYFRRHRSRYNELLFAVSARSGWAAWLTFFLEAVVERAHEAIALADRVIALGREWHERIAQAKGSLTVHRLVDHVHRTIGVTRASAAAHLEVSSPTTYAAIAALEAAGILREVTGRSRDRLWMADELVTLFAP